MLVEKNVFLTVRLAPELKKKYTDIVARQGISISEHLRHLVLRTIEEANRDGDNKE